MKRHPDADRQDACADQRHKFGTNGRCRCGAEKTAHKIHTTPLKRITNMVEILRQEYLGTKRMTLTPYIRSEFNAVRVRHPDLISVSFAADFFEVCFTKSSKNFEYGPRYFSQVPPDFRRLVDLCMLGMDCFEGIDHSL